MKFWQSRYNPLLKLSQQDLLAISKEITQTYAPHDNLHKPELVLMPVDPINLYAYWNLKDSETFNSTPHFSKQLALRVYTIPELSENSSKLQLSFDINVHSFKSQQKVQLPIAATAYSAVIGEIDSDNNFSVLATSDTIHVPRENPVSENSLNSDTRTIQTKQTLERDFVAHPISQKSPLPDKSPILYEKTVKVAPAIENIFPTKTKTQNARPDTLIIKNFNDYGYDLVVSTNKFSPEITTNLYRQNLNIHSSKNKSNTIDKNTSGKGR